MCNGPCTGDYDMADRFMIIANRIRSERAANILMAGDPPAGTPHQPAPRPVQKRRRRDNSRIPHFGRPPQWLLERPFIGRVPIHPSHVPHLKWHRGLTWCGLCGTYATVVPVQLRGLCLGAAGTIDSLRCLNRLNRGLLPPKVDRWPEDEDTGL